MKTRELETEYRAVVEEILELRGDDGRISAFVRSITEPGALADTAGYSPDLSFAQKVELLDRQPALAPQRANTRTDLRRVVSGGQRCCSRHEADHTQV